MDMETAQAFAIGRTTLGGSTVLAPSGAVTFGNCDELRASLEQASEGPQAAVVLDLRQVNVLDSAALELLTEWHQKLDQGGGMLKLAT